MTGSGTSHDFVGRHALVIGGSAGLGLASAKKLAAGGARLTVVSRSVTPEGLSAEGLPRERTLALQADTVKVDAGQLVQQARSAFGPIDTLILSGGGPKPGTFVSLNDEDWTAAYELLLLAPVRIIRAALPDMQDANFGRIVAVLSSGVKQPLPNLILSNALRAGALGMLQSLAREVAPQGVTVNGVVPGRIDTDRVRDLDARAAVRENRTPEEVRERSQATIPLGRYGRSDEFASAVAYLASRDASYVTGSLLEVDGGLINTLT
ncbi:SDR family oxidoreductase [Deinococcus peraridilitoris]|uniref:Short-chain alcohol dehydrogenase like protein n=1 Tax=Deinococcus peraridilitoris (strain DSM 19664 / LMG 22246 / CIP 109416 / KR-200) TaxID=937777 RepID=L0A5G3_DEIPD|nr:SDR family oxidoreductase [Deinococcus peraridilitoris]AFZ68669.1 dehydrogenase of unknown specificity, short-chain alcohol dehydrogenase like protein [Deinococcus peraridilitoris DSM 19664]